MLFFRCPICKSPLKDCGDHAQCPNRHSFDRAAEGYYHLLPSNKMHAKLPGDSKEMVAARRAFLNAGYYQLFSDGINEAAEKLLCDVQSPMILDAGCGEGYYTARLKQALSERRHDIRIAGFDISKFAVKAAAKRDKKIDFAVASIFDIPAADGCCDLVLNVFAPIVPTEFARVLKPGGVLLIAVPSERHLFGLKEILYESPYYNEKIDTVYEGFDFLERIPLRGTITITDSVQIANLFSMTPYYWKTPQAGCERLRQLARLDTEIGFDLLLYRREQAGNNSLHPRSRT
ncbi:MAG: methyltransferase domain-containing protein [Clostridiales bacterium]|nr:methyltransferase domain-containing protein [Clostridiales bacterium]